MALVELFRGEAGGMGDAQRNPANPDGYDSTLHGIIAGGGFSPYMAPTEVTWAAADYRSGSDWRDANGNPLLLVVGGGVAPALCQRIDADGAVTEDRSFTGKTITPPEQNTLASAVHSDGSTAPYFFTCFGTSGDIEFRTRGGSWSTSSGTPAQADGLLAENGNLWLILTNGYQVRKFPAGTNPTSGTAGAAIDVGDSNWDIRGAAVLARSYVVFVKPDGIYVYDIDTNRFENIAPWLKNNVDQTTGRGTREWAGDVYVPLGWGGMLRVTQNLQILDASPVPRLRRPDVETPGRYRVSALAGDASYLWALHEPYWQLLGEEIGLKVFTTSDDSSFNDRTAVSTDNDAFTNFTLNDIGSGSSTAFIYVGATSRFLMPVFGIVATAISATPTMQYWDGDSWETVALSDYTAKMTRIAPLYSTARVPDDWAQVAVDGTTRFWLRVNIASNVQSATAVFEVRVLPDVVEMIGTNTTEDAFDRAGARTHVFRGYPVGQGFHWDDIASLKADHSMQMFLSRIKSQAAGRSLIAVGALDHMRLPIGISGEPRMERYPNCVNGFPSLLRLGSDDRIDENEPRPIEVKDIEALYIYGEDANEGDRVQAWVKYDGQAPKPLGFNFGLPCVLRIDPDSERGRGYRYAIWVGIEDAVRDERVPLITRVLAQVNVRPRSDTELGQ